MQKRTSNMRIRAKGKALGWVFLTLIGLWGLGLAATDGRAEAKEVTIAIILQVAEGKDPVEAVEAMKEVGVFISKQPGLIDGVLLQSSFPGNSPSHVHIMRWRELRDWEAISGSDDFQKLLDEKSAFFDLKPAEVFMPVE